MLVQWAAAFQQREVFCETSRGANNSKLEDPTPNWRRAHPPRDREDERQRLTTAEERVKADMAMVECWWLVLVLGEI